MALPIRTTSAPTTSRATDPMIRWGGIAGLASGIVITVGWIYSVLDENMLNSWIVTVGQAALIFGILAAYAAQAHRLGRLGRSGFALTVFGEIFVVANMFASLMVMAKVGKKGVESFVSSGDVAPQNAAASTLTLLFIAGLILFGIATSRAGVFPRWAGRLLWIGSATLLVGAVPDLTAVELAGSALFGAGFVWIGWLLWTQSVPSRA